MTEPQLAADQERAFALLSRVGEAIEAAQDEPAIAAAQQLADLVSRRPDDGALAGFATMALDAALWLIAGACDAEALALCEALVTRLAGGSDAQRAVVAGARLLAAQAAGRLGETERARGQLEQLAAMGEPALAGLERVAGRLASAGAPAAWHAQVAAASATVLWRLGRVTEARTFAHETAASFARLDEPELEAQLRALEREIAGEA